MKTVTRRGFTLIEMIIVIVLIGVITTVAAQIYSNVLLNKKVDSTVEYVGQLVKVIETYRANEVPNLLYRCVTEDTNGNITYSTLDVDCFRKRGVPIGKSPFNTEVVIGSRQSDKQGVICIGMEEQDACQKTANKINEKVSGNKNVGGSGGTDLKSSVLYYAECNNGTTCEGGSFANAGNITHTLQVIINGYKL